MEVTIKQALQQGVTAQKEGKLQDAERLYRAILQSQPKHPDANHNLGVIAISVNQPAAALPLFKIALEANSKTEQFWLSYIDALIKAKQLVNAKQVLEQAKKQGIGEYKLNTLEAQLSSEIQIQNVNSAKPPQKQLSRLLACYQTGQYDDAEKLAMSITQEFPTHEFGWKVLGAVLKQTGRISESLPAMQKAAQLAPQDAEAHSNLGTVLQELGRLDEAEASLRQAIALKHDFNEAFNNLGDTLQLLGRLDEAEANFKQAIALKPDYALAHSNLGTIFYSNGNIDAAIESFAKANDIDPKLRVSELALSVLRARKAREKTEVSFDDINKTGHKFGLSSNPLCLNREVEPELVLSLFKMQSRKMDEAKNTPVFGNGRCSLGYHIFDVNCPIIKTVEKDLIRLMEVAVKSKIYLYDSFFNIYGTGAGIPPHMHLNEFDKNKYLNLAKQKYSLVYYLSVGDQDCSEPGIFKLYDPEEEILPCEGMIVIIPAGRLHSAVYNGKKDRIIIGINFYSL